MKIVVGQLGARMYYATARILSQAGMLERLHTDAMGDRGLGKVLRVIPRRLRPKPLARVLSRAAPELGRQEVATHWGLGLRWQWLCRRARTPRELAAAHMWAGDELCRQILQAGVDSTDAIFIVGSSSRIAFTEARRRGIMTIMEAIIAPPAMERALMDEEMKRFPGWETGVVLPNPAEFERLVQEEFALADLIVCGSSFVRGSIAQTGGPLDRCVVVPYGISLPVASQPRAHPKRPLRVITVGAVGLRKGSGYVAEAAAIAGNGCEFRLVGPLTVTEEARVFLAKRVQLTGAVARTEISAHYAWADVFLLPSICEGSATVIYEALAWGLPVITTLNSGSLVQDGREGFIVPIRNANAIVDALERLSGEEGLYERMSAAALACAAANGFEAYARNLTTAIRAATKRRGG